MAVIQDEQGNNKPIKTDTSHVFDVNGNPLHGELFIGETIASDDVEEIDGYAHESEIATINSNLTELSPYIPVDTSTLVKTFSSNDSFTVTTSGWYLFTTTCPSATDSVRVKFGTYVYITTSSPLLVPIKAGTVISALATSTYNIKMTLIS